jgi:bacterioferritin
VTNDEEQSMKGSDELIRRLNDALSRELRSQGLYAHYAAYVKGIHRLHLKPYFEAEASESVVHAQTVRNALVRLGGIGVTERHPEPITHTTDYKTMLSEALRTERQSLEAYQGLLPLLEEDEELYDAIEQILFAEERSVEELLQLI